MQRAYLMLTPTPDARRLLVIRPPAQFPKTRSRQACRANTL